MYVIRKALSKSLITSWIITPQYYCFKGFFLFNLDVTLGVWAAFLVIWILHLIKNEEIETEQKQNVLWMCDKFTQRFLLSIRNLFEEFYSNISVLILFHSDTSRETLFVLFWCSWQASRIFWLARTCVSIIHTFIIFLQKNFSIFVCFTLFLKTKCLYWMPSYEFI